MSTTTIRTEKCLQATWIAYDEADPDLLWRPIGMGATERAAKEDLGRQIERLLARKSASIPSST